MWFNSHRTCHIALHSCHNYCLNLMTTCYLIHQSCTAPARMLFMLIPVLHWLSFDFALLVAWFGICVSISRLPYFLVCSAIGKSPDFLHFRALCLRVLSSSVAVFTHALLSSSYVLAATTSRSSGSQPILHLSRARNTSSGHSVPSSLLLCQLFAPSSLQAQSKSLCVVRADVKR